MMWRLGLKGKGNWVVRIVLKGVIYFIYFICYNLSLSLYTLIVYALQNQIHLSFAKRAEKGERWRTSMAELRV